MILAAVFEGGRVAVHEISISGEDATKRFSAKILAGSICCDTVQPFRNREREDRYLDQFPDSRRAERRGQ